MPFTRNTGVEVPQVFSSEPYDRAAEILGSLHQAHPEERSAFAAAWNAVAYRYRAAHDYHAKFAESVAVSSVPPGEDRYRQDHCLFGFATAGVSAIECIYFALYCIGSIVRPEEFPLSSATHLRGVHPADVARRLSAHFGGTSVTIAAHDVLESADYKDLLELRHYLTHRGTLPRLTLVGGPSEGTYVAVNPRDPVAVWRPDRRVDDRMIQGQMAWLTMGVNLLIEATASFAASELASGRDYRR